MCVKQVDVINDYMKIHGNEQLGDFSYDNNLINSIKKLNELEYDCENRVDIHYITRCRMKHNAEKFINNNYKYKAIGYLPDYRLKRILNKRFIENDEELIDLYNKSAKFISPFKLPIKYSKENIFDGRLVTQVLYRTDVDDTDYLKRLNLYFERVELPKRTTEVSTSSYIHEITHALLESHKGLTNNYYNAEIIPIFNELLYAYEHNSNMYYLLLYNRLNNVFDSFNNIFSFQENTDGDFTDFDYHTSIKYMTSILKAFQLLYIYLYDNKAVINQIGRTLEGNIELEQSLSEIGITNDSYLNPEYVKKLIKK